MSVRRPDSTMTPFFVLRRSPFVWFALVGLVLGCRPSGAGGAGASDPASGAVGLRCEKDGGFSAPNERTILTDVPSSGARATVLELWAPSCVPCQFTVPEAIEQRAALAEEGIQVLLLGVLEEEEPVALGRAKLASWGAAGEPFLVDYGGVLMRRYGISGPPASVVLDARGNLRWTGQGKTASADFASAARAAAAEPCSP